jgi:hypothetical protein
LLGTDGGLFFSANAPGSGGGGNTWDNGKMNIGTSTFLITHITGTPLNADLLMIGTQVSPENVFRAGWGPKAVQSTSLTAQLHNINTIT